MDELKNKQFAKYDYNSRYTNVPYYYNTKDEREIYGLGSNLFKNTEWVSHELVMTDTLYSLALKYYNNPTYWWVIAYFNNIQDPFMKLMDKFKIIKIPNIASIEFGNERK